MANTRPENREHHPCDAAEREKDDEEPANFRFPCFSRTHTRIAVIGNGNQVQHTELLHELALESPNTGEKIAEIRFNSLLFSLFSVPHRALAGPTGHETFATLRPRRAAPKVGIPGAIKPVFSWTRVPGAPQIVATDLRRSRSTLARVLIFRGPTRRRAARRERWNWLHCDVACLDVHKDTVVAACALYRTARSRPEVRTFRTITADL